MEALEDGLAELGTLIQNKQRLGYVVGGSGDCWARSVAKSIVEYAMLKSGQILSCR